MVNLTLYSYSGTVAVTSIRPVRTLECFLGVNGLL